MADVLPDHPPRDATASPGKAHKYSTPLPFLAGNHEYHNAQSEQPATRQQPAETREQSIPVSNLPQSYSSTLDSSSTPHPTTQDASREPNTLDRLSIIQEATLSRSESIDSFTLPVNSLPAKSDAPPATSTNYRSTPLHQGTSSFSSESSGNSRASNVQSLKSSSDSRTDSVLQSSPRKPDGLASRQMIPTSVPYDHGRTSLSSDSTGGSGANAGSGSDSSSIFNPSHTQKYSMRPPGILRTDTGLTSSDSSGHSRKLTATTTSDSSDSRTRPFKVTRFHEPSSDDDASITTVYPRFSIGDIPDDYKPYPVTEYDESTDKRFSIGDVPDEFRPSDINRQKESTDARFSIGDVPEDFRPAAVNGHKESTADRFSIGDVPDNFRPSVNNRHNENTEKRFSIGDVPDDFRPSVTNEHNKSADNRFSIGDVPDNFRPSIVNGHNEPADDRFSIGDIPDDFRPLSTEGHDGSTEDRSGSAEPPTVGISKAETGRSPSHNQHYQNDSKGISPAEPPIISTYKAEDINDERNSDTSQPVVPPEIVSSRLKPAYTSRTNAANTAELPANTQPNSSSIQRFLQDDGTEDDGKLPGEPAEAPVIQPVKPEVPTPTLGSKLKNALHSVASKVNPLSSDSDKSTHHHQGPPAPVETLFSRATPGGPDPLDSSRNYQESSMPTHVSSPYNHALASPPQVSQQPHPSSPPQIPVRSSARPITANHPPVPSIPDNYRRDPSVPKSPNGTSRQVMQDGVPTKQKKVEGVFFEQVEGTTMRSSKHDHENEENELEIPEVEAREVREI